VTDVNMGDMGAQLVAKQEFSTAGAADLVCCGSQAASGVISSWVAGHACERQTEINWTDGACSSLKG
jgi:hypothetical protein